MTGQKRRIINRFEREAKKKYKEMERVGIKVVCPCDKTNWHLVPFTLDEIKKIINFEENIHTCTENGGTYCHEVECDNLQKAKGCGKEFMYIKYLNDKRICGQMEDLKHGWNILLCDDCKNKEEESQDE